MATLASEIFSTSSLKLLNGIQRNLKESKISIFSTMLVFLGTLEKPRWLPWPLLGETLSAFLLNSKLDPNVLYQVFFPGQSENQYGLPGLRMAKTFSTSFLQPLYGTQPNLTEARSWHPLPSLCFFVLIGKPRWRPGLWLADTFLTYSLQPLNGIQQTLSIRSSMMFEFLSPIRIPWWLPWPLIGWDNIDFFSATTERNSTKINRRHPLPSCVFFCWGVSIIISICSRLNLGTRVHECGQLGLLFQAGMESECVLLNVFVIPCGHFSFSYSWFY